MLISRRVLLPLLLVWNMSGMSYAQGNPDTPCSAYQPKACSVKQLSTLQVNIRINIDKLSHDYPVVFQGGHARRLFKEEDKPKFDNLGYPEILSNIQDYALQGIPYCAIDIYMDRRRSVEFKKLNSSTEWVIRYANSTDHSYPKGEPRRLSLILEAMNLLKDEGAMAKISCISPFVYYSLKNDYGMTESDTELMKNNLGNYIQLISGVIED